MGGAEKKRDLPPGELAKKHIARYGLIISAAAAAAVLAAGAVCAAFRGDASLFPAVIAAVVSIAVLSAALSAIAAALLHGRLLRLMRELLDKRQALEESERRSRGVLDGVADVIFTLDSQDRFLFVNAAAEKTLGYGPAELLGRPLSDFSAVMDAFSFFDAGSAVALRFRKKNGEEAALECMAAAVREPTGELRLHGVARETGRQASTNERARRNEKLATLSRIVSGVAHELRNSVMGIMASVHSLKMRGTGGADGDLQRVLEEALRAQRVVGNLLEFTADKAMAFHPCSLNAVLEDALELCRSAIQGAGILTVKNLDPAAPKALANEDQIRQVFINIITNAVHAMQGIGVNDSPSGLHGSVERAWENIKEAFAPPGPIEEPRGRLMVSTRVRDGTVVCTVSDTGPGIPPNLISRIFDTFFTTKPEGEGAGLGLSVSLGIIKAHGGDITAANGERGGACFSVMLPALTAEEAAADDERPAADLRGKRILVVEDEDSIRDFICNFLRGSGCEVTGAPDVREAIAFLAGGNAVDLVISDFRMPDIDGQGLYDWLRSNAPALVKRIIYITGDGLNPLTRAFLSRTGVPYMLKPVAAESLVRTVWPMLSGAADFQDKRNGTD